MQVGGWKVAHMATGAGKPPQGATPASTGPHRGWGLAQPPFKLTHRPQVLVNRLALQRGGSHAY